jgi:DNA-binding beta-propeller fold protein YncE
VRPAFRPLSRRAILALGIAGTLAACGGSSGSSTATSAAHPSTVVTDPATTAATSTDATTTSATPTTATAAATTTTTTIPPGVPTIAGMPPNLDARNIYSETLIGKENPVTKDDPPRVYVPTLEGRVVVVIDPATFQIVDRFTTGQMTQHVVPGFNLRTLYANASGANQLIPIDPVTGKPGAPIPVDAPYNLYFTPDGGRAVVQAERRNRIDYYKLPEWKLIKQVKVPCNGNNHADWSADGSYFLTTCEFSSEMIKVDTATGDVIAKIALKKGSMPQDVRLLPDGKRFYIADMAANGVWIMDGDAMQILGFIPTARGAHAVYPSRDTNLVYVPNRGRSNNVDTARRSRPGEGTISVIDWRSDTIIATWEIPGGGSPDMGGVTADGKQLWLSGRYDDEVYVFDTANGNLLARIKTPPEPHGLVVWPQQGRYSLGHTGNFR